MAVISVAIVFAMFGVFIGSLAISVKEVEHAIGISHAAFGSLLAVSLVVGGAASALVTVRVQRNGEARTMRECLVIWGLLIGVTSLVGPSWLIALFFVTACGASGSVDSVMNTMAASAVQSHAGKLTRIHAMFCLGAAVGAASMGFVLAHHWSWRITWLALAIVATSLALLPLRSAQHVAVEPKTPLHASLAAVARGGIRVLAIAFLLSAIVESAMDTWGPLYLRQALGSTVAQGTAASVAGYFIAFLGRMFVSVASDHVGPRTCILVGSLISTGGLVAMVLAHTPLIAGIGLALTVGGITANWPLLMSIATTGKGDATLVSGGLTTVGYVGLVIGPAILGFIAGTFSLRTTIAVVGICAVVMLLALTIATAGRPQPSPQPSNVP